MRTLPSQEKDTENPEWTTANFAKAMPFSGLPDGLRAKLSVARRKRHRSKSVSPYASLERWWHVSGHRDPADKPV